MKTQILNSEGKKIKEIETPKYFESPIREDLISKIIETKKTRQPYSPSPLAGKQQSAKGAVVHRRHVWKSGYGRGASRVPRKTFSRRGTQFNWQAAEIPFARGGMRAHPPKILAMINTSKINKKEMELAFKSELSATANDKIVSKKYSRLNKKEIKNVPFIIDKFEKVKTKEIIHSIKTILGTDLFNVAIKEKKVRAGIGTRRGRKYKSNAGMLIVLGKDETLKISGIEVKNAPNLSIIDLAKGGAGRLTLYTEKAIKDLEERIYGGKKK
jgi:large subunit ribosomal protein L4e